MIPESVSILFNVDQLLIYFAIAVSNTVLLFFVTGKFYLCFQQCSYHPKEYKKWLKGKQNNYLLRLMVLALLAVLFFLMMNICFAPLAGIGSPYIGFMAYLLFMIVYLNTERHVTQKIPLKKTRRMVRLMAVHSFLYFIINLMVIIGFTVASYYIGEEVVWVERYFGVCLTPLLAPFVLLLAYYINEPFERANNRRYIKRTKQALDAADVIKIGITGSYGKTSVKNILTTLLSIKYRVLATPGSYNTPLGISLTAKKLDSTHDVFIAEMGARYVGDIADLASLVNPHYAILTSVNTQHLETFETEDNIKKTKYELFERLREDGMGFFSSDNEGAVELYNKFNGTKFSAGVMGEENLVTADDIVLTEHGTEFTLRIRGEEPVKCVTTLLGRQNISNICLAAAVAYKMKLSANDIALGVNRLTAIKNRLELVPNNKDIFIIDDSYNSNVDGVKAALEVLKAFKGRKIVVTPGLVELGKQEALANLEFGKQLGKVCDKVIIIGKHNAEMLIKGLFEAGKQGEDIIFAKNLEKGNEMLNGILQKGDVVLFENDLPDTYE